MARAEDRQKSLHEELAQLFTGQLADEFLAHMVTVREKLAAFDGGHGTEAFEDSIADAAHRLSAQIVREALVSLDTQAASIEHRGERYRRKGATKKRLLMRALRRRSQKDRTAWEGLDLLIAAHWPKASIRHPWSAQWLVVRT